MKGLIDIGAHWAQEYFEFMPKERDSLNFLFFEPVKETYDEMCKRLPKTPNIKTFNFALGNHTGQVMIHVSSYNNGQSSSILTPKLHLTQYPQIKFLADEAVGIFRLDDIEYDRGLYDNLHIDVEGYELNVFEGAVNSLKYINVITCEVSQVELQEGRPLVSDIDRFLEEQGFVGDSVVWIGGNWGDKTYKRP